MFEVLPAEGRVRIIPTNLLSGIEGAQPTSWSIEDVRAFFERGRELLIPCCEGVLRFKVCAYGLVSVIRQRKPSDESFQVCREMGPRLFFFELRDAAMLNPSA